MGIFESKESITLTVEGMTCEHCENRVKTAVQAVDGVRGANADKDAKQLTVTFAKKHPIEIDKVIAAVSEAGYTASQ